MRLNRFTVLYLTIVTFAFISVRQVLHSAKFASIVSQKVTSWLAQGIGGEVAIEQIRLELFPLGMVFKNVRFRSPSLELDLSHLNVGYGYENIFKSDVVIDEVVLAEGVATLKKTSDSSDNSKKESPEDIIVKWHQLWNQIHEAPIKIENVRLKRFKVTSSDNHIEIPNALFHLDDRLTVDIAMENIYLKKNMSLTAALPDSLELRLSVDAKKIDLEKLIIKKELAQVLAKGSMSLEGKPLLHNVEINVHGPDDAFTLWITDFQKIDPSFEAFVDARAVLNGDLLDPQIEMHTELQYVDSKFLKAEKVNLEFNWIDHHIALNQIQINDRGGWLRISGGEPFSLNEEALKRGVHDLDLELNNFPTKTAFHFLAGKLDPLVANLNGKLKANLNKKSLSLSSRDGLTFKQFRLQLSKGEPLLSNDSPRMRELDLKLDFDPFKLNLESTFEMKDSQIEMTAHLSDDGIKAKLLGSKFSFNDFKKVQDVELQGEGALNIDINGPWNDVRFNFLGELNNASVAQYSLGDIKLKASLPLKKEVLLFPEIKGRRGLTRYTGAIALKLGNHPYPLSIDFNAPRATFNDLREIIKPIVPAFLKERSDFQTRFQTNGHIQIDFDDRPVKLDVDVNGDSLSVMGEYFDAYSTKIKMNAGRLSIQDLTLKREGSVGHGQLIYDTDSSYLEYEFAMADISLTSFNAYRLTPLALEGNLDLDIYGSGLLNTDHSLRATLALRDSTIHRTSVPNSKIDAYYSKGEWTFQAELMDGMGRLEAFLPVNSPKKSALIRFDLSAPEIAPLVGLLSPTRMNEPSLKGRAMMQVQASFPVENPELADVKVDVRDVTIGYRNKVFKLTQGIPLQVSKGNFQQWNLTSDKSSDLRLAVQAKGRFAKDFSLNASYGIPAEFFELLSDRLVDMTGVLDGRTEFSWSEKGITSYLNHNARDVQFRLRDIPGRFSNIVFDASFKDNEIVLQNFSGNYGRGNFNATGKAVLLFPYPTISFKFNLTDITYPLFDRSEVNFDSRLSFVGTRPPYLFSGQVLLQQANLVEDVGTYLGEMGGGTSYERFIPNTTQSLINQYVEVDLGVISNGAIRVSNPLMEMVLDARLNLTGELASPLISGRVAGVPSRSKIAFKGHEFALSKATVDFDPEAGPSKAILDLTGRTTVSGYNINLLVNGALDQMNILLSSEPALPQDEIVSLLTLGITSDISRNLNDEDRRSVTTMSLGGFLFDQLQLTRGLDSNLGLKVSLAPEFSSDEGNLIEEASSDTSTSRRLKTGTKLRVQSQLGKKTSVSFSSTLGGEVEQKQEMNVNYDFNRTWSLQGVYELKSSVEENQGDTQSLGADVKYRWSF